MALRYPKGLLEKVDGKIDGSNMTATSRKIERGKHLPTRDQMVEPKPISVVSI